MLRSIFQLEGALLVAVDGEIGRCRDFLFDDERWVVRYMVARTGKRLHRRDVLISPISFGRPDWTSEHIPVQLTREQVEHAPGIDEDAPVSRQFERHWFDYFGYTYYWTGGDLWGAYAHPQIPVPPPAPLDPQPERESDVADSHLQSVNEVKGYHLHAHDGAVGHVADFVVDDLDWSVRYLGVDTRWLPRRRVLLSTQWIAAVDWAKRELVVDLDVAQIESSPEYDSALAVQREYEDRVFRHYGREGYW